MKKFIEIISLILILVLKVNAQNNQFPNRSPCDNLYWYNPDEEENGVNEIFQYKDKNGSYAFYPLQTEEDPTPVGLKTLYNDHGLLIYDPLILSVNSNEIKTGYHELVFLKGVGEYYELYDLEFYNFEPGSGEEKHDFSDLFDNLSKSNINLIRIFIRGGHTELAKLKGRNEKPLYIFPFVFDESSNKFKLHYYNDINYNSPRKFFPYLRKFLEEAANHNIFVILCLFDFSEEINSGQGRWWRYSAWNPNNNDHHGLYTISDPTYDFFNIFDNNGNLNNLGITQRDFVLKVVYETRNFYNVIYDIASKSIKI